MAKGKSMFLGFMIGGVVSATATLLTVPSSGKKMRTCAKEQGMEWRRLVSNLKHDGLRLKDQITATSKEGATMMKGLTREMKKSVEDWKTAVEPHQDNIQEYLGQIETSLKDLEEKVKKQ